MREIKQLHTDFKAGHILFGPENYTDDNLDAIMDAQGLHLGPQSDRSPDNYIQVKTAIEKRPPAQ